MKQPIHLQISPQPILKDHNDVL
uniref:Uncharacterized protein n=1 Tax=Arundo donax TaxID=35708 RepID=A0A0A8Y347_ARUDO